MDLDADSSRPRSIAVVGATEPARRLRRRDAAEPRRARLPRARVGRQPARAARARAHRACRRVADLPEPVDAVVVAIPAAGVPDVIEQAGARGCGGAVVFAAGFGETPRRRGACRPRCVAAAAPPRPAGLRAQLQRDRRAATTRAALWGDALVPARGRATSRSISQSGNVAVNALASRRGLRLHTVVSCGNQAVARRRPTGSTRSPSATGVRSVALYLEDDGDGARLCEALGAVRRRRHRRRGAQGRAPRAAGRRAPPRRTPARSPATSASSARWCEEAGAAWAQRRPRAARAGQGARGAAARARAATAGWRSSPARAATRARRRRGRSGSASSCPRSRPRPSSALRGAAAGAPPPSPTRSTTRRIIWGEVETLRDMIARRRRGPGHRPACSSSTTSPHGLEGALRESWDAVREGIRAGARGEPGADRSSPRPCPSCSTTRPRGRSPARRGRPSPACAPALACAAALRRPPRRRRAPARDRRGRARAGATRRPGAAGSPSTRPRRCWPAPASAVRRGPHRRATRTTPRRASPRSAAPGRAQARRPPSCATRPRPAPWRWALEDERDVRAPTRACARSTAVAPARGCSSSAMAPRRASSCSCRRAPRRASCPSLAVGLGGVWTEALDDVAVVPLPADAARVERGAARACAPRRC